MNTPAKDYEIVIYRRPRGGKAWEFQMRVDADESMGELARGYAAEQLAQGIRYESDCLIIHRPAAQLNFGGTNLNSNHEQT